MSTTLPEPPVRTAVEPDNESHDPAFDSLQDRLPEWMRTTKSFAVFGGILSALFFVLSFLPIYHTDVWGHLAYGRFISETRALPTTEPLLPLLKGVPFIDSAWLSQLVGYQLVANFGNSAIRFLYAACITLSCGLLMARMQTRTRNPWMTFVGLVAYLGLLWIQLAIVRPQLAGMVCCTALLCLMTGRRFPRWGWAAVIGIMMVWANVHGSFPVGIAILGAFAVGRAVDILRRTNRFGAVLKDETFRRNVLLTQLAFAATLLNPYGLALWSDVVAFWKNPNLADLVEWEPLSLRMKQGQAAAVVGLILVVLYRLTPRRVTATEVLLQIGLGGATLWTSRMIVWWAPVAAYYLALHGNAAYHHWRGGRLILEPVERRSMWTATAFGLFIVPALVTPFGGAVLHNRKGDATTGLSGQTPVGAVEYLHKNPPRGQVFNTYELGDYLLWAGPKDMKVFFNSHAHLVPEEIWRGYLDVVNLSSGWKETLELYSVNTVVLDNTRRRDLARALKRDEDWRIGYEDHNSIVLVRRKPL
jgi:hypothetical protein